MNGPAKDSFFAGYARFEEIKGGVDDDDDVRIMTYECKDGTYDQFVAIYKLIVGARVSPEEVKQAGDLIAFFNFNPQSVLVDLAVDVEAEKSTTGYKSKAEEVMTFEKLGWGFLEETPVLEEYRENGVAGSENFPDEITLNSFMWGQGDGHLELIQDMGRFILAVRKEREAIE